MTPGVKILLLRNLRSPVIFCLGVFVMWKVCLNKNLFFRGAIIIHKRASWIVSSTQISSISVSESVYCLVWSFLEAADFPRYPVILAHAKCASPMKYQSLRVRVRNQISPGEFTRREQCVLGTTECRIFWLVSFLSLLRTKQNWEKALPLTVTNHSWGLKGKTLRSESLRPNGQAAPASLISPTKQDSLSIPDITPTNTCPHGFDLLSLIAEGGETNFPVTTEVELGMELTYFSILCSHSVGTTSTPTISHTRVATCTHTHTHTLKTAL